MVCVRCVHQAVIETEVVLAGSLPLDGPPSELAGVASGPNREGWRRIVIRVIRLARSESEKVRSDDLTQSTKRVRGGELTRVAAASKHSACSGRDRQKYERQLFEHMRESPNLLCGR